MQQTCFSYTLLDRSTALPIIVYQAKACVGQTCDERNYVYRVQGRVRGGDSERPIHAELVLGVQVI